LFAEILAIRRLPESRLGLCGGARFDPLGRPGSWLLLKQALDWFVSPGYARAEGVFAAGHGWGV